MLSTNSVYNVVIFCKPHLAGFISFSDEGNVNAKSMDSALERKRK